MSKQNKHQGSSFYDFLREENLYEEVCATVAKRILAAQIAEALIKQKKSVSELAIEMKTSRVAVKRILDEKNYSLSLKTLSKLAYALGKQLKIELVEAS